MKPANVIVCVCTILTSSSVLAQISTERLYHTIEVKCPAESARDFDFEITSKNGLKYVERLLVRYRGNTAVHLEIHSKDPNDGQGFSLWKAWDSGAPEIGPAHRELFNIYRVKAEKALLHYCRSANDERKAAHEEIAANRVKLGQP